MKRLWSKVDVRGSDECWPWLANKVGRGYGMFHFDGKSRPAHRIVYLIEIGEIPDGHDVHHTCGKPDCCNPAHLETVPHGDHQRRHMNGENNWQTRKKVCGVCGGPFTRRADGRGRWCKPCQKRRERAHRARGRGS